MHVRGSTALSVKTIDCGARNKDAGICAAEVTRVSGWAATTDDNSSYDSSTPTAATIQAMVGECAHEMILAMRSTGALVHLLCRTAD